MSGWRDWGYRARRRTVVLGIGAVVVAVAVWLVARVEPTKSTYEPTAVRAVYGFLHAFDAKDTGDIESRACAGNRSQLVNHVDTDLRELRSMSVGEAIEPEVPYEDDIEVLLSTVTRTGKRGSSAMDVSRVGRGKWCVWDVVGSFDPVPAPPAEPSSDQPASS